MKIYLTGSTGMLGSYVLTLFKEKGYDVVVSKRDRFDLNNPVSCYQDILLEQPDVVVHLAAETNVDLCEKEPTHAALFNTISTEAVAKAAGELNSFLVYVSTSNVFGHEGRQSYNELDVPYPVNYYGKSKLYGEEVVKKHCNKNHLIIRSGWMIGGGKEKDHKFVGKIVQQIQSKVENISAVEDKFGSITSAFELSKFIYWGISERICGTYHFASKGGVSRYQIAKTIADYIGFSGGVLPVKSCNYPLSAPRPTFETIESAFICSIPGAPVLNNWKDDLINYIECLVN